jgi:hypothetical protein
MQTVSPTELVTPDPPIDRDSLTRYGHAHAENTKSAFRYYERQPRTPMRPVRGLPPSCRTSIGPACEQLPAHIDLPLTRANG